MIGQVIDGQFFRVLDYPTAAALSVVLMVAILALVTVYVRRAGTEELRVSTSGTGLRPPSRCSLVRGAGASLLGLHADAERRRGGFSFNNPAGRYNYTWSEFSHRGAGPTRAARRASASRSASRLRIGFVPR